MTKEEWIERCNKGVKPVKMKSNINDELKKKYWPQFAKFLERQFENGSGKYAIDQDPDKEMTDLVCELSPGKTGADWVMQNIVGYAGRYLNLQRESDLFKIATYAFIMWLKMGYYLKEEHEEDLDGFIKNE